MQVVINLGDRPPPDNGCWAASSCLDCPWPKCVEDMGQGESMRFKVMVESKPLIEFYEVCWYMLPTVKEAQEATANHFGVTTRTVARRVAVWRAWLSKNEERHDERRDS